MFLSINMEKTSIVDRSEQCIGVQCIGACLKLKFFTEKNEKYICMEKKQLSVQFKINKKFLFSLSIIYDE